MESKKVILLFLVIFIIIMGVSTRQNTFSKIDYTKLTEEFNKNIINKEIELSPSQTSNSHNLDLGNGITCFGTINIKDSSKIQNDCTCQKTETNSRYRCNHVTKGFVGWLESSAIIIRYYPPLCGPTEKIEFTGDIGEITSTDTGVPLLPGTTVGTYTGTGTLVNAIYSITTFTPPNHVSPFNPTTSTSNTRHYDVSGSRVTISDLNLPIPSCFS